MDAKKIKELEAKGWKVGSAAEFLQLTEEEVAMVETRLALSKMTKQKRQQKRLSQEAAAKRIGSSQSRFAKLEAGDSSVSVDLMLKAVYNLGASREEVAEAIAS